MAMRPSRIPPATHVVMTTFYHDPATSFKAGGQVEAAISSSTPGPDIRLLIVDDYAIMAAGLRMLLESHPRMMVVGIASNREDALALAACEHPDVILYDLNLDSDNGIELLSALLTASPGGRLVVLTDACNVQLHREAIALGAVGLVLKEQAAKVLLKVIERVHEGEAWIEPSMLASMLTSSSSPIK
jgi:DNA-binding NarL/FixJ family response regulator